MNWLDIVLIGLVIVGALRGFRIGLLGAAVNAFALILGWLLASQAAYALGLVGGFVEWSSTSIIVAVYVIVIALTVSVVQFAWGIIRRSLGIVTLGASSLIDRVGGLVLGIVKTFIAQTAGLPLNSFGFVSPGFAESLKMIGRKT